MSVQAIYNHVAAAPVNTVSKATEKTAETTASAEKNTGFSETAVVYEKSNETEIVKPGKNSGIDREAIIAQMKADTETRMNQMQDLVHKMMQGQGNALAQSDDIWSFLASGNYTVSEAAKLQAQEDISENGYWGVEQTSQRILDFAKALAGNDVNKADELLEAFKKGYKQATGAWGKTLPDISKQTYDAVEKKFAAWKSEASNQNTAANEDVSAETTAAGDTETIKR